MSRYASMEKDIDHSAQHLKDIIERQESEIFHLKSVINHLSNIPHSIEDLKEGEDAGGALSTEAGQKIDDLHLALSSMTEILALNSPLINGLPGYIYWKNAQNQYIGCNQNYAELFDVDCAGIIGKLDTELAWHSAELINDDNAIITQKTSKTTSYKLPIKRADGNHIYLAMQKQPIKNPQGKVIGLISLATDITAQKVTEFAFAKAKQDNIIAGMPGYIYWKNRKSEYMGCNNNLAEVSGLENRYEIVGRTDYDFDWGQGQAEAFIKDDKAVMEETSIHVSEHIMPIKREDGYHYHVRTEKIPLFDGGEVIGVLAVAVDMTDQKILEEELRKQKERAELANAAKSRFLGMMSHELRTPMNAILGIAQVLKAKAPDKEFDELLGIIFNSGKTLLILVEDILDFAQLEEGRLKIREKIFNFEKLIHQTVESVSFQLRGSGIKLSTHFAKDVPLDLTSDPNRIQQLVFNLVSNAVKFTHKGYIKVKVTCLEKLSDEVRLCVSVEDSGIGISQDKLDLIFERFSQVDTVYSRRAQGVGLGLAICRQLVGLMGGEIHVDSTLGKGSRFWFILPYKLPVKSIAS